MKIYQLGPQKQKAWKFEEMYENGISKKWIWKQVWF